MATVVRIGGVRCEALDADACDVIVTLVIPFTDEGCQVMLAAERGARVLLDNGTGEPWPGKVISADVPGYVIEAELDA